MTSLVAENNTSVYNLLFIIIHNFKKNKNKKNNKYTVNSAKFCEWNKLSRVLSLLIPSGEPEDIVDEGNFLK